jgi:hypothetical protein
MRTTRDIFTRTTTPLSQHSTQRDILQCPNNMDGGTHAHTPGPHGNQLQRKRWKLMKRMLEIGTEEQLDEAARYAGFKRKHAGKHEASEILKHDSTQPTLPPGRPVYTYTPAVLERAKALLTAEPHKAYDRQQLLMDALPDGRSHDPGRFIEALRTYLAKQGLTLVCVDDTVFFLKASDYPKRTGYSNSLLPDIIAGKLDEEDLAFADEVSLQSPPHPKSECMHQVPLNMPCT